MIYLNMSIRTTNSKIKTRLLFYSIQHDMQDLCHLSITLRHITYYMPIKSRQINCRLDIDNC